MQNNFLGYNPGLERRITHTFDFNNMTPQDLAALALMNMQRMQGWEIDVADLAALTTRMADLIKRATTPRQREMNNGNVAGIQWLVSAF